MDFRLTGSIQAKPGVPPPGGTADGGDGHAQDGGGSRPLRHMDTAGASASAADIQKLRRQVVDLRSQLDNAEGAAAVATTEANEVAEAALTLSEAAYRRRTQFAEEAAAEALRKLAAEQGEKAELCKLLEEAQAAAAAQRGELDEAQAAKAGLEAQLAAAQAKAAAADDRLAAERIKGEQQAAQAELKVAEARQYGKRAKTLLENQLAEKCAEYDALKVRCASLETSLEKLQDQLMHAALQRPNGKDIDIEFPTRLWALRQGEEQLKEARAVVRERESAVGQREVAVEAKEEELQLRSTAVEAGEEAVRIGRQFKERGFYCSADLSSSEGEEEEEDEESGSGSEGDSSEEQCSSRDEEEQE
ncbi:hypothetical protein C2E21_3261 [Chlorella sorokiniana]|uniref:Uncharacterized protein n=1 Tax=Chlorella sorokiniana TaxID=3076 RepID=A0A2P6TWN1_CHLSO|nr:hypothetical protein C2E21_3261 [Chlorella sorokiniana]|eukprot:PRW58461.1 hypothetical protein C2E21_3261 [Chlorella sorokiniana]